MLDPALLPAKSSDVKEFARRLDLAPDSKFTEFDSVSLFDAPSHFSLNRLSVARIQCGALPRRNERGHARTDSSFGLLKNFPLRYSFKRLPLSTRSRGRAVTVHCFVANVCFQQGGTMLAWAVCQVNYEAVMCLLAAGSFLYTTHPVCDSDSACGPLTFTLLLERQLALGSGRK